MRYLVILFSILCFSYVEAQSDPNARDIRILTEWFEGEFDNDSQLWLQGRRDWKGAEEEKHGRIHATHIRIDAPLIGDHVFYVEEYIDDTDSIISRQRIVSFESIVDSSFIEMKIYFLNDANQYYLHNNEGKFDHEITEKSLFSLDGCNLVIRREGEQYKGHMRFKACQFGEGESERYSVHDIIISQNQYWRIDQTYLLSNNELYAGNPSTDYHKMRKAQNYTCDVSFYEKAYYLPSDLDKKYKDVIIHNQGGSTNLYNPIEEKSYLLQIREKEYPFYQSGSDFLMIRFKAEDSVASNVIVTASPGTVNLSFNIGTASASCKLIN